VTVNDEDRNATGFHEMWGIRLAVQRSASQEVLCSMDLVHESAALMPACSDI